MGKMRVLYGNQLYDAIFEKFKEQHVHGIHDEYDVARKLKEMYTEGIKISLNRHPNLKKDSIEKIYDIKMCAEHIVEECFQIVWECLEPAFLNFDETATIHAYLSNKGLI